MNSWTIYVSLVVAVFLLIIGVSKLISNPLNKTVPILAIVAGAIGILSCIVQMLTRP
ncbi:hypothetical protein D3C76_777530 [compost metagenome]